ncbi:MAG: flagellar hook-basal body complex protein FliE [Bacteroidetes bacterium]|nr:flagellar hook-basal body complex protein FliE [Bacteroidota bacterium]
MAIKSISPEEVVSRMRELVARAQALHVNPPNALGKLGGLSGGREISAIYGGEADQAPRLDFQSVLKEAVRGVSDAQNVAQVKAQSYQLGDDAVTLEDVMISIQKANLAMQGMVQVRNRLVEAYREVMNLQV